MTELPAITRNLVQDATYWAPGDNDGQGGVRYAPPTAIKCRWEQVAKLFRSVSGQEAVSEAAVYVDRGLALRGRLALGAYSGTPDEAQAKEVRYINSVPSLRATKQLHMVYL